MRQEHRGHLVVSRISIKSVGRSLWLTMRLIRLTRNREKRGKSERKKERERAAPISHAPIHAKQVQKWFLLVARTQRTCGYTYYRWAWSALGLGPTTKAGICLSCVQYANMVGRNIIKRGIRVNTNIRCSRQEGKNWARGGCIYAVRGVHVHTWGHAGVYNIYTYIFVYIYIYIYTCVYT